MRIPLFVAALFSAFVWSACAFACTSIEHVSAERPELVLTPGSDEACLRSDDDRYELHMQNDGKLALYDSRHPGRALIWSPTMSAEPQSGSRAVFKNDGSFIIADASGKEVWRAPGTGAGGPGDYFIKLGKQGRVEIYKGTSLSDAAKTMIWASATDEVPNADGECQCHIVNTDGSPGRNQGKSFPVCGLTACLAKCSVQRDYFGDNLIGTYNKGTGQCKAF